MFIHVLGRGEELTTEGKPATHIDFLISGEVQLYKGIDTDNQLGPNPVSRVKIGTLGVKGPL
jgi:CRP-like cAMP-binding protein